MTPSRSRKLIVSAAVALLTAGCAAQSNTTDAAAQDESSRSSQSAADKPRNSPNYTPAPARVPSQPAGELRPCPESRQESGASCRRTTLDGTTLEIVLTIGRDTAVSGEGTMPSELARYRFLGHAERFHQCALAAATAGWRGKGTAMVELRLAGSKVAKVTTESQQLPENFTTCVSETTRRLRFTRAPDGKIRVVQPIHVEIGEPET